MGLAERTVDRQLSRAKGEWPHRLRVVRLSQNVMLAAVILNLVGVVGLNLLTGVYDRRVSVALAVLWLGIAYMTWRQRAHLDRRAREHAG